MRKSLIVHAHFYQPSREDPLTGTIPQEAGAAPFHDWNEKIHSTCYAPNARLGNYAKISFNMGPTLWQWMSRAHPETCSSIVEQVSQAKARTGFSNAMAQPFNHTILPLANTNDKRTQVIWGIRFFEHMFGFPPKGMWLPETAVDIETLRIMAENGIQFTILAPWQVKQSTDVTERPFVVKLSHKKIGILLYEPSLSTQISFDPSSTENADQFLKNLVNPIFNTFSREKSYIVIASDGELYGHHQPFRDYFLSYLMDGAISKYGIEPSLPEEVFHENSDIRKIAIRENTSWSCSHGVERWRSTCACTPHGDWKRPLRDALNNLAQDMDNIYFDEIHHIYPEPWKMRDEYIDVIIGKTTMEKFLFDRGIKAAKDKDKTRLLLLSQFERQRMFTSCGWFFEDFDRIEPRNNVQYCAQAIRLLGESTQNDLRDKARNLFRRVLSWRTGLRADRVFDDFDARAR
jgi:alpha-amylase/alpha-mannosidase (GH57 family)